MYCQTPLAIYVNQKQYKYIHIAIDNNKRQKSIYHIRFLYLRIDMLVIIIFMVE